MKDATEKYKIKNNLMKTLKNITKFNYLWIEKSKNIKYMPNTMGKHYA